MAIRTSEYKVISDSKTESLEKKLNDLAADGWEIAHVTNVSGAFAFVGSGTLQTGIVVILRRDRDSK